jgi:hypothetical protein
MSHQHRPLGSWCLDERGLRLRLDRRVLVRSALGVGATIAALLGSSSAQAFSLQKAPPALLGAIPAREGVLSWDSLAQVEAPYGQVPRFSAALTKLNGQVVVIEGHIMVLDDDNPLQRFLLTAYDAHCPFCIPGGFASIVAVHAERPFRVADRPLIMSGILRLLTDSNGGGLLYRLDKAVPA